jgi:hypothetical protein
MGYTPIASPEQLVSFDNAFTSLSVLLEWISELSYDCQATATDVWAAETFV